MTTLAKVERDERGNYTIDGKKYPSVTTIIKTGNLVGLDDGLGFVYGTYTAKEAIKIMEAHLVGREYYRPAGFQVVNNKVEWLSEPVDVEHWVKSGGCYDYLRKCGHSTMGRAADRGTLVHFTAQLLAQGHDVTGEQVLLQYGDGLWPEDGVEGYLDALIAWWHSTPIEEVYAIEVPGVNLTYGYAGTLDLVAKIGGQVYLVDFKTSSSLQASHFLQLSAYRQFEHLIKDDELVEPKEGLNIAPALVVLVGDEKVTPYRIEPDVLDKWFVMFRKVLDLKLGTSSIAGMSQRLKELEWKAF